MDNDRSQLDFSICAQEPIHIPNAIQPHGALLAVRIDDLIVTHASANLIGFLGIAAERVLGQPLEDILDEAVCRALKVARSLDGAALCQMNFPARNGKTLRLTAFQSDRHICIDIEPNSPGPDRAAALLKLQSLTESFKLGAGQKEICTLAVRGLREITGYDRVMAYRFDRDGHGEVVAEARIPELESFLGLRYPASDIPPQARKLYLRKRVGAIIDSSYRPVPLLADRALDDGAPLDLTHSALRSVSPFHCEYMRNMKTAASLTIALSQGENLWGMLVCHHCSPRIPEPELRAVADILGQVVSLRLAALGEAEVAAKRFERNEAMRALVDGFATPEPMADALAAANAQLLDLVDSAGALVRFEGTVRSFGRTPPLEAAKQALRLLYSAAKGEPLALDDLTLRYPELAACKEDGSGALLLPLAKDTDDAILWFRREVSRTTRWGGNPNGHVISDPATGQISPRSSFAVWKQTVSGRSVSWLDTDLAIARELKGAIEGAIALRAKAELIQLRLLHEERQRIQSERLKAALENLGDGVAMFDAGGRLVVCNNTYGALYNLPNDMQSAGTRYQDIVDYRITHGIMDGDASGSAVQLKLDELSALPQDSASSRIEKLADGRLISVTRQPLKDGGWVGTHEDITDRHQRDAKIAFLAHHDLLTGLANRVVFSEGLNDAMARLRRLGEPFTVFMLDLDKFKNVNDTLGHAAGDQLLKETALRLKSALRETDVLARLGGDEFAIIQSGEKNQIEGAEGLADRLVKTISKPYVLDGHVACVGVSIGIALAPGDSAEGDALLTKADAALYAVKSSGRNGFQFFHETML